jgi:hypothetical protein
MSHAIRIQGLFTFPGIKQLTTLLFSDDERMLYRLKWVNDGCSLWLLVIRVLPLELLHQKPREALEPGQKAVASQDELQKRHHSQGFLPAIYPDTLEWLERLVVLIPELGDVQGRQLVAAADERVVVAVEARHHGVVVDELVLGARLAELVPRPLAVGEADDVGIVAVDGHRGRSAALAVEHDVDPLRRLQARRRLFWPAPADLPWIWALAPCQASDRPQLHVRSG